MRKIKNFVYRRRMVLGVSGLVAAAVLATGVALSLAAGSSGVPAPRPTPAPPAQTVSSAIAAELPVLNRPATPADALPAGFEGNPEHWLQEQLAGANGALARRVRVSKEGTVYLIPSSRGVCMLNVAGPPNFCATVAELDSGEAEEAILCSSFIPNTDIEIGGILPEGVTDPSVVLSSGISVPLSLEGNTYVADFPRSGPLPTEIKWTSADGQQHTASAHVPSSAATERCGAPPAH